MLKPPVRTLKYKDGRLVGQNIEVCAVTECGNIFWVFEYKIDRYYYNHKESVRRTWWGRKIKRRT